MPVVSNTSQCRPGLVEFSFRFCGRHLSGAFMLRSSSPVSFHTLTKVQLAFTLFHTRQSLGLLLLLSAVWPVDPVVSQGDEGSPRYRWACSPEMADSSTPSSLPSPSQKGSFVFFTFFLFAHEKLRSRGLAFPK